MNKVKKIVFVSVLIITLGMVLNVSRVESALQANGKSTASYAFDKWPAMVRGMEALGGTFGLSETINSSSLLATTDSNNLDTHMQLNTEYGAMAILSASSYGNPEKVTSGGTTTGNSTGIVMPLTTEWVSGADFSDTRNSPSNGTIVFRNMNSRYKNQYYHNSEVGKIGDATIETQKWHGATDETNQYMWISSNVSNAFCRSYGNIFAYTGYYYGGNRNGLANYNYAYPTRVVVIVGQGV